MINKVIFGGRLGRDVEMRYLPSGDAVANFSIASSEKWRDKQSGDMKEETEWLRCNAFGKLAEICGQYLKKGSLVYVEGKLKTRKWTDKDGVEKQSTECKVEVMKMLGGKDDNQQAAPSKPAQDFYDLDSDIPF